MEGFEIRDRARSEFIRIFAVNIERSDKSTVSVSRGKEIAGDENHAADDLPHV